MSKGVPYGWPPNTWQSPLMLEAASIGQGSCEDGVQLRVQPFSQPQDGEHRIVYCSEVSPKIQDAVFPRRDLD